MGDGLEDIFLHSLAMLIANLSVSEKAKQHSQIFPKEGADQEEPFETLI